MGIRFETDKLTGTANYWVPMTLVLLFGFELYVSDHGFCVGVA